MTDPAAVPEPTPGALCTVLTARSADATGSGGPASESRREIGDDVAHTVLEAASRRLSDAIAAFDDALDQRLSMTELQFRDQEMAVAERDRVLAQRRHATVSCRHPEHDRTEHRSGSSAGT